MCKYNVPRSGLEAASKLTPGKRSPTVTTLHPPEDDWVAVEVMIGKKEVADTMDNLWEIGAKDILVWDGVELCLGLWHARLARQLYPMRWQNQAWRSTSGGP